MNKTPSQESECTPEAVISVTEGHSGSQNNLIFRAGDYIFVRQHNGIENDRLFGHIDIRSQDGE